MSRERGQRKRESRNREEVSERESEFTKRIGIIGGTRKKISESGEREREAWQSEGQRE